MAIEWEGVHDGDRVGEENSGGAGVLGIWYGGGLDVGMENITQNIHTPYYEYLIISASCEAALSGMECAMSSGTCNPDLLCISHSLRME